MTRTAFAPVAPQVARARAHSRRLTVATLLLWPAGLVLVALHMEVEAVTLPVYLVLDVVYVAVALALVRSWGSAAGRAAVRLLALGVGLFGLVGFTGEPTAAEPGLMLVNTAALLLVAVALLQVVVRVVVEHRDLPETAGAVPGIALLLVGTAGYCANLVARVAVVLSGAADQQAAVEDSAWVAFEYLRGLEGSPEPMAYLLVWFDLLQVGYVATTYICVAGICRLLMAAGQVGRRTATALSTSAVVAAMAVVGGVAATAALPRELDLVPAWTVFVLTIPFMTTLVPFLLGVALLRHQDAPDRHRIDTASTPPPDRSDPSAHNITRGSHHS